MTCQGRNPRYFNEEEQADMVDDILNALEYALGPAESEWGGMRARMGHEKPFRLDYPCDPWSMRFLEVSRWILSEGKSWIARDSFPPRPMSDIKTVHLKKNDLTT